MFSLLNNIPTIVGGDFGDALQFLSSVPYNLICNRKIDQSLLNSNGKQRKVLSSTTANLPPAMFKQIVDFLIDQSVLSSEK